jgi:hypothetical protein
MIDILGDPTALNAAQSLLVLAASFVFGLLAKWVRGFVRHAATQRILIELARAVGVAVREVSQSYVDAIKESSADGKLTPAERNHALLLAIKRAKALLGKELLRQLSKLFGLTPGTLDDWIGSHVEATVADRNAHLKAILPLPPRPGPVDVSTSG